MRSECPLCAYDKRTGSHAKAYGCTKLGDVLVRLLREDFGAALGVVEKRVSLLEVTAPDLLAPTTGGDGQE